MKKFQLSDEELKILQLLSQDSRMSYKQVAKKTGVAISTVHNIVERLKEQGVLKNFTINIDSEKLGYDITVLIGVVVENGLLPEVEQRLVAHPNVCQVFTVTGNFDISFVARFKNTRELNNFIRNTLQKMKGVKHSNTSLVLDTLKNEDIF